MTALDKQDEEDLENKENIPGSEFINWRDQRMQANGKDNIGGKKEKPELILNGLALSGDAYITSIIHAQGTWKTNGIFCQD